jgi:DNA-binding transcriptional MerR regulator
MSSSSPKVTPTAGSGDRLLAIGQAAAAAGVTPRALRYYEELGLLRPSGHSRRGARRYSEPELARITRIRELQQLMGFNLDEIRQVLAAEDSLERIRNEYRSGKPTSRRRRELLAEAIEVNDRLREQVRQKVSRIGGFLEELDAKAVRYRQVIEEIEKCPAGRPE